MKRYNAGEASSRERRGGERKKEKKVRAGVALEAEAQQTFETEHEKARAAEVEAEKRVKRATEKAGGVDEDLKEKIKESERRTVMDLRELWEQINAEMMAFLHGHVLEKSENIDQLTGDEIDDRIGRLEPALQRQAIEMLKKRESIGSRLEQVEIGAVSQSDKEQSPNQTGARGTETALTPEHSVIEAISAVDEAERVLTGFFFGKEVLGKGEKFSDFDQVALMRQIKRKKLSMAEQLELASLLAAYKKAKTAQATPARTIAKDVDTKVEQKTKKDGEKRGPDHSVAAQTVTDAPDVPIANLTPPPQGEPKDGVTEDGEVMEVSDDEIIEDVKPDIKKRIEEATAYVTQLEEEHAARKAAKILEGKKRREERLRQISDKMAQAEQEHQEAVKKVEAMSAEKKAHFALLDEIRDEEKPVEEIPPKLTKPSSHELRMRWKKVAHNLLEEEKKTKMKYPYPASSEVSVSEPLAADEGVFIEKGSQIEVANPAAQKGVVYSSLLGPEKWAAPLDHPTLSVEVPKNKVEVENLEEDLIRLQTRLSFLNKTPKDERNKRQEKEGASLANQIKLTELQLESSKLRFEIEEQNNELEIVQAGFVEITAKLDLQGRKLSSFTDKEREGILDKLGLQEKQRFLELKDKRSQLEKDIFLKRQRLAGILSALVAIDRLLVQDKAELKKMDEEAAAKEAEAEREREERERMQKEAEEARRREANKPAPLGQRMWGGTKTGGKVVGVSMAIGALGASGILRGFAKYFSWTSIKSTARKILDYLSGNSSSGKKE